VISKILSLATKRRLNVINSFASNGVEIQYKQLKELLSKAKNTQIGKRYDFSSITSIEEFKNRVPIKDYDDLMPDVIKLKQGETNLLWPGEVKWFAKSSGTTSTRSKFIPITKDSLNSCHYQGGRDSYFIYQKLNPNSKLFTGKTLVLGGSQKINEFSNKSVYGDLSAILIDNMPKWASFFRTPPKNVALMNEWESKLKKITEITTKQNVVALAGVPSWFLILLKNILDYSGKDNLLEIWPNLELFVHGGVNFTPYREQYQNLIPSDKMLYQETYNASEGFFAIQNDFADNGMLLMLDYGIFYEFMPLSEVDKENPKTLLLDEVELNKDYALVITTNGGLWRYLVGDTVRFTSKSPYKIIVSGRTKHFINAFGEEIIINNADKALKEACDATGAIIKEFTAAPIFMSSDTKGSHQWLIEFEKMPKSQSLFIEVLDKTLKEVNSDYDAKRYKDLTLEMPTLTIARDGLFMDWMKSRNKVGGQNKVPRLSNNRDIIDDILKLNR